LSGGGTFYQLSIGVLAVFLIRLIFKLLFVAFAALAGNLVGYQMRERMLGEASHDLRFYQRSEDGEITIAINPILTNFLPALLVGMLARTGVPVGFFAGVIIGAVIGDQYEEKFFHMLGID
jgi:hypothetical protein